ncbi:HNH endonuclease signature motif containing protein [Nocardiopsis dassonvillei]|uniref:HNH endonuclease signature motif containing protein n=2 Tax=Nocardiopsis TaxID=2013 RepID=UPI000B9D79FF|nr:HNH endonuclease signature motif containing protein [Nocardiopsis dassonvillei]ASU61368.1 HNH endonuclease [Nocardiopsis dassonvillei]
MIAAPKAAPGECSPAVAALAGAREIIHQALNTEIPPGADEAAAEEIAALWAQLEKIRYQALAQMARLYARGEVARYSGYSTLDKWITHRCKVPTAQAKDLARLAQHVHEETLPATIEAVEEGALALGEAVAIAKATDKAVQTRDAEHFPEEGEYRHGFEAALVAAKVERPALSVNQLQSVARQVAYRLDPHRLDRDHEAAHAARGLTVHDTFQGSYQLQAWGGSGDALIVRAAIDTFNTPPGEGDTRSRSQREHDALIAALRFATTHTGCDNAPAPLAQIRIVVPVQTYLDAQGQERPALDEHGRVIPVGVVHELAADSEVVRMLTAPPTGQVLDVGHSRRLASTRQRTAAFHGHATCAHPGGCEVPVALCQADHVTSFSRGGRTVVANLQPLCGPHNRAKYQRELRTHHQGQGRGRRRGGDHPPGRDPDPPPRE